MSCRFVDFCIIDAMARSMDLVYMYMTRTHTSVRIVYMILRAQDCVGGGRHKAEAAAESLKLIFPGVQAEAVDLSIPMPGHSVGTTGTTS